MKRLVLSLSLSAAVWGSASAGRNADGAIVLHHNDSIDWCVGYDLCTSLPLPPRCSDLDTMILRDPGIETVVWVVGAFLDSSNPAVYAYQFGVYGDLTQDYYTAWGPCGPSPLEIPDSTWPGTGTGTAVAYNAPVFSRLFKMYWFACGAPGAGSSLSTGPYPHGDGQAEFVDDSNPPVVDLVHNFGTCVWGGPGHNDCPQSPATGACCSADGSCKVLTQAECTAQGGTYLGDGTSCNPNPCGTGACCLCGGVCQVLTAAECQAQHGTYHGGTSCTPDPCWGVRMNPPSVALVRASVPIPFVSRTGASNPIAGGRDACWSNPPDLNGLLASSEIIGQSGVTSEIASDFVPTGGISHIDFGAGAFAVNYPCENPSGIPGINVYIYDDDGCFPGSLVCSYSFGPGGFTERYLGCQDSNPLYLWGVDVDCCNLSGGSVYWASVQVQDHVYEPQFGRLSGAQTTGCEDMFKSTYFGYPDWTCVSQVIGTRYDFSQEFTCRCGGTRTQPSTWGQIKSLFR